MVRRGLRDDPATRSAAQITDYSRAKTPQLAAGDQITTFARIVREAGEVSSKGEVRFMASAGAVVPVQISISGLVLSAPGSLCAVITDLREQKRNQELLTSQALERTRRAEAEAGQRRIANILESITDSFLAMNRDWRVTDVNQRLAAILGKTRDELIGKCFGKCLRRA